MDKINNGNGSYWKGTVDQKLDQVLDMLSENKLDHKEIKSVVYDEINDRKDACAEVDERLNKVDKKVQWIIGVGTGVVFIIGIVLMFV